MRRARRWLLICACAIPVGAGVAYWYFLYAPAPDAPRLGSSVEYDSIRVGGFVVAYPEGYELVARFRSEYGGELPFSS